MRLFEVFGARESVDCRIDLVDAGERMKNDHAGFGKFQEFGSDPVGGCIVCKSDRVREPLALEAGHIQHVELGNCLFYIVMADEFYTGIQQVFFDISRKIESVGSYGMDTDIIVFGEGKGEGVDGPSVSEISLQADVDVFDPHGFADGEQVEQGLGRVLAGAVASVDNRDRGDFACKTGGAFFGVTQDDRIAVSGDDAYRVRKGLTFGDGGGFDTAEVEDLAAKPTN